MAHYPNPFAAIRSSWLIKRARKGSPGLSQTALAEDIGVTPTALSKYENGSREPSFADLQRIIAHTDHRLIVGLRKEPRTEDRLHTMLLPSPTPFAVSDHHLAQRLPATLAPTAGKLPSSVEDGPHLEEALLLLYELQQLARDARLPEARLQETYEQFHNERDRDLIHHVLPVGAGAGQAAAILARTIHHRTTRTAKRRSAKADHSASRAPRLVWAHIVCCLRAEEAICRERAAWQHRAVDAARLRRNAESRVHDAEFLTRHASRATAVAEVDQATAELEKATQRCADWSRNGGAQDVGLAGERYLAVELNQLADRARTLYDDMAQERAFADWRAEYAITDPLYDAWLDGDLRTAHTPPKLYRDKHAFYRDHASLARPWKNRLDQGDGGPAPFGSDERLVYDHLGRQWQITLTVPSATGDPRTWPQPEAVVVATRCPTMPSGEPLTPVYVLAQNVDGRQTAELITSAPSPGSLTDIAASLRTATRG